MPVAPHQHGKDTHERIAMARLVCVLCMIFVHVPTGQPVSQLYASASFGLDTLIELVLIEGPGRASAALLSAVSGFLVATTLLAKRKTVMSLYLSRGRSILLPMLIWALLTYAVYALVSQFRPTYLSGLNSWLDHLNVLLFLTEMPAGPTMHLGFLRDLFVCVLLAPLLLITLRRIPWLVVPALGLLYLFEHEQSTLIVLRPLVLFAFALGMMVALHRVPLSRLDRFWPVFLVLATLSTALLILFKAGIGQSPLAPIDNSQIVIQERVLYPVTRLFVSLSVWTLLPFLTAEWIRIAVKRCTPYVFAAFCCHHLVLTIVFFSAWQPVFGDRDGPLFIVWFLVAPFLSLAAAVAIVAFARMVHPQAADILTGGRLAAHARREHGPLRAPSALAKI